MATATCFHSEPLLAGSWQHWTYLHRICALDEFVVALKGCHVKKAGAAAHVMLNHAGAAVQETESIGALLHCGPIGVATCGIEVLSLVKYT